ncbi:hypothetical protein LTS18_002405, partial [Coniosporium uncinatum]
MPATTTTLSAASPHRRGRSSDPSSNLDVPLPPAKKLRHTKSTTPNGLEAALFHQNEGKTLTATSTNGHPDARRNHVDESRAVVGKPAVGNGDVDMADAEIIAISSNDEEDEEEDSEDDVSDTEPGAEDARGEADVPKDGTDVDMVNGDSQEQQQLPTPEAPSFGEMLSANDGPIDVEAAFADPHAESAVALKGKRVLTVPSAGSLGT